MVPSTVDRQLRVPEDPTNDPNDLLLLEHVSQVETQDGGPLGRYEEVTTGTTALNCWHLKHSGHQLMAIVADEIVLSRKLKKREVESLRSSWESAGVQTADLHHKVSIHAVEQIVAETARQHLTITTATEEIHVPGFRSKSARRIHQPGVNDNRQEPVDPLSDVVEAAGLIAGRAGLKPVSDLRASVVVFEDVDQNAQQSVERSFGPFKVRPWRPILELVLSLTWAVGVYMVLLRPLEGIALSWFVVAVMFFVLAHSLVDASVRYLTGIVVDSRGVHGAGLVRNREIDWAEISLIQPAFESSNGLRRPTGREIVLHDGQKVLLPKLARRQLDQLDAAINHFSAPFGICPSLAPTGSDRLQQTARRRVRSPIAAKVFGWDL